MIRLLYHIGYPRTATTWMQEGVFPLLDQIQYVGFRYNPDYYYQNDLVNQVSLRDEDLDVQAWRDRFSPALSADRLNVFSCEGFLRPYQVERTVKRMAQISGGWDVSILITIRRQDRLAFSRYAHDLKAFNRIFHDRKGSAHSDTNQPAYSIQDTLEEGPVECFWDDCDATRFVPNTIYHSDRPCACLAKGFKSIPLWFYRFDEVAGLFEQQFGRDRIHFMLLDEIAERPEQAVRRLAAILGIQLTPEQMNQILAIGRINSQEKNTGELFQGQRKAFFDPSSGGASRLLGYFRASNEALLRRRPELPLREYGYC